MIWMLLFDMMMMVVEMGIQSAGSDIKYRGCGHLPRLSVFHPTS
jgi:hypothetical protein